MSNNLGTGAGGASPYDDESSAPLPDFDASKIQLSTVAPALGIPSSSLPAVGARQPDYLDYDQKGRGLVSTMFTNSGISYMLGVTFGGLYGLREGLAKTPSTRFKVKLNSVLNHCGRHGSSAGNMLGATAILYSLYEGLADNVSHSFLRMCCDGMNISLIIFYLNVLTLFNLPLPNPFHWPRRDGDSSSWTNTPGRSSPRPPSSPGR